MEWQGRGLGVLSGSLAACRQLSAAPYTSPSTSWSEHPAQGFPVFTSQQNLSLCVSLNAQSPRFQGVRTAVGGFACQPTYPSLSVFLSVCLSLCFTLCLSLSLTFSHTFSVCVTACLSLTALLSVFPSFFVCLSVCLPASLSVCLPGPGTSAQTAPPHLPGEAGASGGRQLLLPVAFI